LTEYNNLLELAASFGAINVTNEHHEYSGMTKACLVDLLKQHLATVNGHIAVTDSEFYDNRKYYNQAHHCLKIGAFKPVPPFPVSVSDLSPELLEELSGLHKNDRKFVLKQAVGRIFEDINSKLYHDSISRVLEVRLID
jgi:hypothetical protein